MKFVFLLANCSAAYHYTLIRLRQRESCFPVFLHNSWLGAAAFTGLALHLLSLLIRQRPE